MKIKIKDLEPNPFRLVDKFPVDPHKVEYLKSSIEQTGFWDNLLARPHPTKKGKYQLSYGLTRLTALKSLGRKEVDIPVREIDDATMVQIMASENMNQFGNSPSILHEIISVGKKLIEKSVSKYKTWEDFSKNEKTMAASYFSNIGNPEDNFKAIKSNGVNITILKNFFGDFLPEWQIKTVLDCITKEEIDQASFKEFKTIGEAKEFIRLMDKGKVPKEKQHDIAMEIIHKRENRKKETKSKSPFGATAVQQRIQLELDIVSSSPAYFPEENSPSMVAEKKLKAWQTKVRSLKEDTYALNELLEGMGVEKITGIQQFITLDEIEELSKELQRFIPKFGIKIKRNKINAISK